MAPLLAHLLPIPGASRSEEVQDVPPRGMHGIMVKRFLAEAAIADGWGDPVSWLLEAREPASDCGHVRFVAAVDALLRSVGAAIPAPVGGSTDDETGIAEQDAVADAIPRELRTAGVTQREWEVLCRMHDMPTNAELAEAMHLSVRTIEKHVSNLLAKLHADSRRDLARTAQRNDWVAR